MVYVRWCSARGALRPRTWVREGGDVLPIDVEEDTARLPNSVQASNNALFRSRNIRNLAVPAIHARPHPLLVDGLGECHDVADDHRKSPHQRLRRGEPFFSRARCVRAPAE
jgi:hypothetical protein